MIKLFLSTSLILLFNSIGFSQKSEIKSLINEASSLVVPQNFKYFHLVDSSFPTEFNQNSLSQNEAEELKLKFPDFPSEEFSGLAKSDNSFIDWNDFEIQNAKIHPYQSIPQFQNLIRNYQLVPYDISQKELDNLNSNKQSDVLLVRVKKQWDQQRIDKECQDAYNRNSKRINKEDAAYFWFSKPLISKNGYALVTLNQSTGGATYIFKKVDGLWQKIYIFNRWNS